MCKLKRTKKQPQLVGPYKDLKSVKTLQPSDEGLDTSSNIFKYETFPKFDMSLYYVPRPIENYCNEEGAGVHLKTLINNDQLSKMND